MSYQQVTVTYNQSSNSISFSPNNGNVEMDSAGTITFNANPRFTYKSLVITPVDSSQPPVGSTFNWATNGTGDLVVNDNDAAAGSYTYCVTVTVDGNDVSSDPQIINKV